MTRLESPSSINTYKTCARKYFYHYKLNLPTKDSLATINGSAVHTALENFYTIDPSNLSFNNYENELRHHLLNTFNQAWTESVPKLLGLGIEKEGIKSTYQESLNMLNRFLSVFTEQLQQTMSNKPLQEAFNFLKPETEVLLSSSFHQVRGYVDAIHNREGEVVIIDYKTSRSDELTDEYKLQLAIYAMLYQERQGKIPEKAALYFLRHGTHKYVEVTAELVEHAKQTCADVHSNTVSNEINDYEKNLGTWCKWCDYKDYCFGQTRLHAYQQPEEQQ
ncbi:MAG: PD-(D/E)XK nuclease family protein [Candidatus Nanoarchaeia archaeon]